MKTNKADETYVDKPNYGNSILYNRIKTFVLAEVPFGWGSDEMDNLRLEVEQFVDAIHARINSLKDGVQEK